MSFSLENFVIQDVNRKEIVYLESAVVTNVKKLWNEKYFGKGVTVAVIDTGIDINHSNFSKRIIETRNFTSDDTDRDVTDYSGHGTHVAGIIGSTNSKSVEIGIAPLVEFVILKVIGKNGIGELDSIIKALQFILSWNENHEKKIDIVNMSIGTKHYSEHLYKLIKKINNNNIYIVSAAGNYGDSNPNTEERIYPGFFSEVIQVGSTDFKGNISNFTNTNLNIDFVAPGEGIYSTFPQNRFATMSGTSMASPLVVGGLALLLEKYKYKCSHEKYDILSKLRKHAKELNTSIKEQGDGLIQFDI